MIFIDLITGRAGASPWSGEVLPEQVDGDQCGPERLQAVCCPSREWQRHGYGHHATAGQGSVSSIFGNSCNIVSKKLDPLFKKKSFTTFVLSFSKLSQLLIFNQIKAEIDYCVWGDSCRRLWKDLTLQTTIKTNHIAIELVENQK